MNENEESSIQEVKHGKEVKIDYLTVTFEFRSNETVAEMAAPFIKKNDCAGAARRLVDEAYRTWTKDGVICDDITVIVILFKVD